MKTRRLNTVTRILLAIFAMMLFPQSALAQDQDVDYYVYNPGTQKFVKQTAQVGQYTAIPSNSEPTVTVTLNTGVTTPVTYVVSGDVICQGRYVITGSGAVNIILCDGAKLTAQRGIDVGVGVTLNIYGQEKGTGQLNAMAMHYGVGTDEDYYGAAIGGSYHKENGKITSFSLCGYIFIHGGVITADATQPTNADNAAGIGGCDDAGPNGLTIYGGKVTAKGGKYSAGIGGGGKSSDGGTVNIYGGEVIATGGAGGTYGNNNYGAAMGIGAGSALKNNTATGGPDNGTLTVDPNVVYVYGDNDDPDQLNKYEDITYRFRYMKTDRIYGLTFAGTAVTASNASDINSASTGTASFYPATNTLKLDKFSGNGPIVNDNLANLTIELNDANELTGTQGYIQSTKSDATLTFKGIASGTTPSTLELNNSVGTSAVQGFANVLYNGAYLTSNNACGYNTGLVSMRDVEGGAAQSVVITTEAHYPLWVNSTQVKYGEENDILDYNNTNNKASFDGVNTLTLEGVSISNSNAIESFLDNLTINLKGENLVEINTGDNPALCSGVGTAALTIAKDATATGDVSLLLKSVGMYNTSAIQGFSSITYTDTPNTYNVDDSNYPYNPNELVSVTYDTTNKTLKTAAGSDLTAVYFTSGSVYDLWVGNTRVTSANATNVLNSAEPATVSYDPTSSTLTLNDAQLTGDIATSMSDLTIHIKGGCQIIAKSNCIRSSATTPGTLTFTREGAGELALNNMNAVDPDNPSNTKSMSAIKGFSTLAGLPLVTKEPYEIDTYYRLKKSMSSDTATIDYAWVNADVAYPLWVDGKQVTSENKTNVLEEATATVTFDGANTLTLNEANLSDSIVSDLASLTIGLIGDNSVYQGIRSSKATTNLTIAKDAKATGNVSLLVETPYAYAIWGFNSLTYTGFTPYNTDRTLDLTSTISYTSTDRALKDGGSKLNGVYFVSKTDLSATGLSFSMDSKIYTGSAVVLPGTVTMNDGTNDIPLTVTSDYTVTGYKDANGNSLTSGAPTDAGSYYATISGEGVYMGTVDVPFTIDPITASLSWDTKTPLIYNGTPQTPAVSVSNLLSGESCTVTVTGQQTNAGTSYTATATALSNNNYQLPKTNLTQTFIIDQLDLSTSTTLSIVTIDNQTYSGSNIEPKPAVSITLGTSTTPTTLKAEDFDYSYANNINAASSASTSAPTVTITGKGNYKGSSSKTFTILPKSVEGLTVTLSGTGFDSDKKSFVYNGQNQTPTVTVKDGEKLLILNTDYTLVNNGGTGAADDYDVVVTGTGNYDSNTSVTVTYSIAPKSITSAVIMLSSTSSAFNGDTQVPTISSVSVDNVPLTSDVDYTVKSNDGGKNVGTYDVVIQGKGNYDAATTAKETFTIVPCSLVYVTIDAIQAQTYNGSPITPKPTMYIMSGTNKISLVEGTDFDCTSYANNTNAADENDNLPPTVTIKLKGNYDGEKDVKFTIKPLVATLTWSNTSFTYDGKPHKPTAIVSNLISPDGCTVDVTGDQTNASTTQYTATATGLSNGNYQLPQTGLTQDFTISAKSMTDNSIGVSVTGTYTYDDNAKNPTLTVTDGTNPLTINTDYSVIYQKKDDNGTFVNVNEVKEAGTYKAVVTGANNYKDDKSSNEFSVGKAGINGVTVSLAGWTYGDAANNPYVTAGNPGNATVKYEYKQENAGDDTYTETVPTNADTYIVRATVPATANYQEANGTTKFTIDPRVVTLNWTNLSFDYDGDEHVPMATVSNKVGSDVCTVTVTGGQTNAGNNYTATATGLSNNNYKLPTTATALTTNFIINQREVTLTWSNTEFVYDGNSHKPTAEVNNLAKTTDVCNVTVDGAQTLAGDYTATASALDNTNYKLPTPNPTTTFTIKDRTANITFNAGQKYKTFYSAGENLLVPDNVRAYVVTGVTGNTVNITQISYIHANAPVLLESSSGAKTVKDPNETLSTNLLKYASADVNTNGKQYVLYSGEFVKATGTIPVGRVYLELPSSSARTLVISTDNTTAIDASFKDDADGEEKWYDMQGRQINKPTKAGLYIKNGQKVVIKNK